jgi:hypothetical protein
MLKKLPIHVAKLKIKNIHMVDKRLNFPKSLVGAGLYYDALLYCLYDIVLNEIKKYMVESCQK